jgi:hypothetical protein
MTDPTTLSAAELDELEQAARTQSLFLSEIAPVFAMARRTEAAERTVAGIRAFILKYSHPDEFDKHAIAYGKAVLAHLDKLSVTGQE